LLLFFILPIGLVVVVTFFNYLDAATSLQDLSRLRSVGPHKLKGERKAQWAMTVDGPWRICFRFARGDADDVEIVDYHKG
jgi:toxin HigB-1